MLHEGLTGKVLYAAGQVSGSLGPGFLESLDRRAMVSVLQGRGLRTAEESPFRVFFRGHEVGEYRADLVAENTVLLELKAVKSLLPVQQARTINQLKASALPVALLINCGTPRLEDRRCHPGATPELLPDF